MAEKYNTERAEDTLAVRTARRLRLFWITAIGLIVLLAGLTIWFLANASASSKRVLREAKDVRTAMKMVAIESYSNGANIFDPSRPDGLVEGGAEKLASLSQADGDIVLTGWDKAESDALSFTYTKGNYTVFFKKNGEDGQPSWDVFLRLKVTDF